MTESHSPIARDPQVFQDALLDGVKTFSVLAPSGIALHQIRIRLKNPTSKPVSTSPSSNSLPSQLASKSIGFSHQLTKFLKLNGLLTFGFGLIHATITTSVPSFIQHQKADPILRSDSKIDRLKVLSNDYSIIGGTLGGLITATIFWNRGFLSLIQIIPGGMGIGVGTGLSTAYLQSIRSSFAKTQPLPELKERR